MSSVEKLMEKTRQVHVIDDIEFLCHRWNATLALEAFGPSAFALVGDGDQRKVQINPGVITDRRQMTEKVLGVAMISPRLGDHDDAEKDTVSMRTLGGYAYELFGRIIGEEAEAAANFPESSEGREE